jgi:phosphatidylinositol kinase/protein kinase (PI-3  family)
MRGINMELNLELALENVYGGDGFKRPLEIKETKLSRSKTRVVVRKDIGVPIESEKHETKRELKEATANTFKQDEEGKFYLKLGGMHGKLWGTLKEIGYILCETGELKNKSSIDRIMKSVLISPEWVRLENVDGIRLEEIPQVLYGVRNPMVIMYYDVIPKCTAKVSIKFPDEFKNIILKMLRRLETVSCLNKRRATIKILNNLELD